MSLSRYSPFFGQMLNKIWSLHVPILPISNIRPQDLEKEGRGQERKQEKERDMYLYEKRERERQRERVKE